jgi:hypothetical protein
MYLYPIAIILVPILGVWFWMWSEKKEKEKKIEEENRKKKKDIQDYKKYYFKIRAKTTFESIKTLPHQFEKDEMIYFQTGHHDTFIHRKNKVCSAEILFYSILTNKKLIIFHSHGIDDFRFDEIRYFIAYEGIVIIPNKLFKKILIRKSTEKLVEVADKLLFLNLKFSRIHFNSKYRAYMGLSVEIYPFNQRMNS